MSENLSLLGALEIDRYKGVIPQTGTFGSLFKCRHVFFLGIFSLLAVAKLVQSRAQRHDLQNFVSLYSYRPPCSYHRNYEPAPALVS